MSLSCNVYFLLFLTCCVWSAISLSLHGDLSLRKILNHDGDGRPLAAGGLAARGSRGAVLVQATIQEGEDQIQRQGVDSGWAKGGVCVRTFLYVETPALFPHITFRT